MKILIINGPNLNLLGERETDLYGNETLTDIQKWTEDKLKDLQNKLAIEWFQSNSEFEIINKVHHSIQAKVEGIVINPGAFSHTSLGIRDALKCFEGIIAEVHLTNVFTRSSVRHKLLTAQAANFIMKGLGKSAYYTAARCVFEKYIEVNDVQNE